MITPDITIRIEVAHAPAIYATARLEFGAREFIGDAPLDETDPRVVQAIAGAVRRLEEEIEAWLRMRRGR